MVLRAPAVGQVVPQADEGRLARLESVKADEAAPSVIFQRLTDGERPESLREIARAWELPTGRFIEWFTTEHSALYDAALKVRADMLGFAALEDVDAATVETVAVAKLRADIRLRVAGKWDRKRYGEEGDAVRVTPVTIQIANLRGGTVQVSAPKEAASLPAPEREVLI